jgi:hypothetical protein
MPAAFAAAAISRFSSCEILTEMYFQRFSFLGGAGLPILLAVSLMGFGWVLISFS